MRIGGRDDQSADLLERRVVRGALLGGLQAPDEEGVGRDRVRPEQVRLDRVDAGQLCRVRGTGPARLEAPGEECDGDQGPDGDQDDETRLSPRQRGRHVGAAAQ